MGLTGFSSFHGVAPRLEVVGMKAGERSLLKVMAWHGIHVGGEVACVFRLVGVGMGMGMGMEGFLLQGFHQHQQTAVG